MATPGAAHGDSIDAAVRALAGVGRDEIDGVAPVLRRVDRKYLLAEPLVLELLSSLAAGASTSVVVDGAATSTGYETLYYDTADFALHKAAARRRIRRYKVRVRRYGGADQAMLEVKAKSGRGDTVKHRIAYGLDQLTSLSVDARQFVVEAVGRSGAADGLVPTLTTRYRRSTLFAIDDDSRVTIDREVQGIDWTGAVAQTAAVVLETKSFGPASSVDRWLWRHGHRPARYSKYCTSLVSLHPELPSNKWHRTLQLYFRSDDPWSGAREPRRGREE